MEFEVIEQTYPDSFRSDITKELADHINKRRSVVFIGMLRVGISNFLRFFLYHKQLRKKIASGNKHLFVAIDLNDLIERTIPSFWVLTLKRILDAVESGDFAPKTKKYIENLFLDGIQSKNTFILIENIKKALGKIISEGTFPTIFFIRFDRISESASADFFANLEGLKNATHNKLSFVFTTSRGLNAISPNVFSHTSLSLAETEIFLKPASASDLQVISDAYIKRFGLRISAETEKELVNLTGGYIQYLQLALITLNSPETDDKKINDLEELLVNDERIKLQSEELWEGLTEQEQELLLKIASGEQLTDKDLKDSRYLSDTGFIFKTKIGFKIFSPLFEKFIKTKNGKNEGGSNGKIDLSKKEHLLFSFLKKNLDQICEREAIIEAVWPEEEALGVSDWAIDRLVARLRKKIKGEGEFEIVTIKTRGFKLVLNS
jgi:hypothetical protein